MTALKILIVMLAALVAISSAVVVKIPSSQLSDVRSQISDLRSTEEHVTQTELINLVRVKENAVKSNGFLAEDVGEIDSFVVLGGDKKADADSLRDAVREDASSNESSVQGDVEVNDELLQVLAEEGNAIEGNETE
jgi:predicted proteasome-type protease